MRGSIWIACALIAALSSLPTRAQEANLPSEVREQIAEMGAHLNPELIRKTSALMQPLQAPRTDLSLSQNIAYGSDPLQTLDLFASQKNTTPPTPIVIFVHAAPSAG